LAQDELTQELAGVRGGKHSQMIDGKHAPKKTATEPGFLIKTHFFWRNKSLRVVDYLTFASTAMVNSNRRISKWLAPSLIHPS
jgi:hypothetical protein